MKALGPGFSAEPLLLAGRDREFVLLQVPPDDRSAILDLAEGLAAVLPCARIRSARILERVLLRQAPVHVCASIVAEYRDALNRPRFRPKGLPPAWLPRLLQIAFHEPEPEPWPLDGPDPDGAMILALAEAIRTGAREPESVLYVAGSQVWVRVPAGLDGFGAAVEVQIDALWDDDLLAVDILKPYLRVREIDGIRGVALKAEPSGHFLALVPAAALEHCTQEASMAISPAAAASTAAPATVDQPKPPARRRRPTSNTAAASPRPSPTTTSPSAKPSPSAVADALLAQVREEHARTTAGPDGERTVIVLTRADIAAAAQAAGLQPQSIRRALMGRPGCTVTADAGVEIAIP